MSNMDSRKVPSTNVDKFYTRYAELVDYDRELLIQVVVAEKIPGNVLEEDPKLLMWYDQAVTRMGGA